MTNDELPCDGTPIKPRAPIVVAGELVRREDDPLCNEAAKVIVGMHDRIAELESELAVTCPKCQMEVQDSATIDGCINCRRLELEAENARMNEPFLDADPRIKIEKRDNFYVYQTDAGECGPYRSWREAYESALGYLDLCAELSRGIKLEAEVERLRADAERYRDVLDMLGSGASASMTQVAESGQLNEDRNLRVTAHAASICGHANCDGDDR